MENIQKEDGGLYRVVHPILAGGVPLEPGLAIVMPPSEADKLVRAGYLAPLAELPPEGAIALGVLDEVRRSESSAFPLLDTSPARPDESVPELAREFEGGSAPEAGRDDATQHPAEGAASLGTHNPSASEVDPGAVAAVDSAATAASGRPVRTTRIKQ